MAAASALSHSDPRLLSTIMPIRLRLSLALICAAAMLVLAYPSTASAAETGISVEGDAAAVAKSVEDLKLMWA